MEVITLPSEVYNDLVKKIDEIAARLTSKEKEPKEVWLDNEEFLKLLKISKRTGQLYRDTGKVSFSQIGSKIFYRLSDVEEMLKRHHKKAFK
jgi:hypothetical protein